MSDASLVPQERIQSCQQAWRESAAFINHKPTHADAILEELIPINIFAVAFHRCCKLVGWYHSPGMHGGSSNELCHGILCRKKLELHTVLPLKTILEEGSEQVDALAFSCPRVSEQTQPRRLTQHLCNSLLGRGIPLVELTVLGGASVNHRLEKCLLLWSRWLLAAPLRFPFRSVSTAPSTPL